MASIQSDVKCSAQGALLEMKFVPDTGTSGVGKFSARYRRAGDVSWSAWFTPQNVLIPGNLRSDGSGYGFDHAKEGPNRWVLALVLDTDSDTTVWWSADYGQNWTKFT